MLTLSPLAVAPHAQGNGVGTMPLAAAIQTAGTLSVPAVFLEGDPRYYAARGWRPAADVGVSAPSVRIPPAACQVITTSGFDASAMRGALVYNDTFWAHDCVGLRESTS